MIISLADVKTILGISNTNSDTMLNLVLPMVQSSIIEFCKNHFKDSLAYSAETISFSGTSILDSSSGFVTAELFSDNYLIEGSKYNDGIFTVSNVAAGTLTVSETTRTETAGNTILITRVVFPKELGFIMAKMAGYTIKNKFGVKSESISNYSVSYDSSSTYITGYPDSITAGLLKYRRVFNDI